MSGRTMINSIAAFFRRLFRRAGKAASGATQLPQTSTASAEVESQVLQKPHLSARQKKRNILRRLLKRTDGGGKHYGSKRAHSNHRGGQNGKRSGRA